MYKISFGSAISSTLDCNKISIIIVAMKEKDINSGEAAVRPATMTASDIRDALTGMADESQAAILQRFFKTGPGEYGEGDRFLGLRSPQTHGVVKEAFKINPQLGYDEIETLLDSPWHEVRFAALLYLVERYGRILKKHLPGGDELLGFYETHAHRGNNWDLVDCVCPKIVGRWLCLDSVGDNEKWRLMDRFAASRNLWRQRISVVSTWTTLRQGRADFTLCYAERHLHHRHPLMHKAVGWMLREMGKRVDMGLLRSFLESHAGRMPRTALRYAIEKMDAGERAFWMGR